LVTVPLNRLFAERYVEVISLYGSGVSKIVCVIFRELKFVLHFLELKFMKLCDLVSISIWIGVSTVCTFEAYVISPNCEGRYRLLRKFAYYD
jgi:hypothetical protein